MSFIRRRVFGETPPLPPPPPPSSSSSFPDPSTPEKNEDVELVPVAKLKKLTAKKSKRRTGFIFGVGGLFGLFVAAFFANQQDVINLEGLMDLNLDSLLDVIPAGIVKDAQDITVRTFYRIWVCAMLREMLIQLSALETRARCCQL